VAVAFPFSLLPPLLALATVDDMAAVAADPEPALKDPDRKAASSRAKPVSSLPPVVAVAGVSAAGTAALALLLLYSFEDLQE
jgi:hypothetical protein